MGMGYTPTWLRQVSPPASQSHFNHWLQSEIKHLFSLRPNKDVLHESKNIMRSSVVVNSEK